MVGTSPQSEKVQVQIPSGTPLCGVCSGFTPTRVAFAQRGGKRFFCFFGTFLCGIQTYGHSRSAISFVTANQSGHPADAVSHQPGGMLVLFPQRVSCLYRVAFIHPGGESSPGVLPFTFPNLPVAG